MRVRAKRWRRDVEATEEASKVQAIADNETDARTLGRLIEAIETPNELDAMFAILDMLRGRRFSISAERRELLRALVNEATWPHQVWL